MGLTIDSAPVLNQIPDKDLLAVATKDVAASVAVARGHSAALCCDVACQAGDEEGDGDLHDDDVEME